ncbi:hypothetical protein TTRE_0000810401 [Trichuris trichiura]|uniref:Uncharacterized protein n=1 Tax=Trichuris trichiura TaxID=36087 RepID=A0A077ZJ48_TRITR|nr:hypothetical protein TTRE_0000810401 [Trichuris trichiura]
MFLQNTASSRAPQGGADNNTDPFPLRRKVVEALGSLWQPQGTMPITPGTGCMPRLSESAYQTTTDNGDGRYNIWQSYSTLSFLRFCCKGADDWEWLIYTTRLLGTCATYRLFLDAGDRFDRPRISTLCAKLKDQNIAELRQRFYYNGNDPDEDLSIVVLNRSMQCLAEWVAASPRNSYDEDVFLRLIQIGMLLPNVDCMKEDRLTYAVNPEFVGGTFSFGPCSPRHVYPVEAMAIPVDRYIDVCRCVVSDMGEFSHDYWDKSVAVIPVRASDRGRWLIPYTFAHLTSMIFNAQTPVLSVTRGRTRLDAVPLASLCAIPGPERVLFVLVDATTRDTLFRSWRCGSSQLGVDVPVWVSSYPLPQPASLEPLFWDWLNGGSHGHDVGMAWENLAARSQAGLKPVSAITMAAELFTRKFWPKALPSQSVSDPGVVDLNTFATNDSATVRDDVSTPANANLTEHVVKRPEIEPRDQWVLFWAKPDLRTQRPYSHLALFNQENDDIAETFWHPSLPTVAPYIVELRNAPQLKLPDDTAADVDWAVVVESNYDRHFDVVPCASREAAYAFLMSRGETDTLISQVEPQEAPSCACAISMLIKRLHLFDIGGSTTAPTLNKCGRWWTETKAASERIAGQCGCPDLYLAYETDLENDSDAVAAFQPLFLCRSSPHMRTWTAEWSISKNRVTMTEMDDVERSPMLLNGHSENWFDGCCVRGGFHLHRVGSTLGFYEPDGDTPFFLSAEEMSMFVRRVACLAGGLFEVLIATHGFNAPMVMGLYEEVANYNVTNNLDALWMPTFGHICGWYANRNSWLSYGGLKFPRFLLRGDDHTYWSSVFFGLTPHYEIKILLVKLGIWSDDGWWPRDLSTLFERRGIQIDSANSCLLEMQVGESLSARNCVPRAIFFHYDGQGEWLLKEAIAFGGPWQLFDHCGFSLAWGCRSTGSPTAHIEMIRPFGVVVHPICPPRFMQVDYSVPSSALWIDTVGPGSGGCETKVSSEYLSIKSEGTLFIHSVIQLSRR